MAVMRKNKVVTCSTPEYQDYSPSRDSDSEAVSPVPFLCTQDGTEGETDVVWNYYTPTSEHAAISKIRNSTPLSRKVKKQMKPKRIQRAQPKRKAVKVSHKNNEFLQELHEINQNLNNLIKKTAKNAVSKEKNQSESEEDIFSESMEYSPKSGLKNNSHCLRKNLLNSKFNMVEPENALESDDSINECLLKASQVIEDNILSKYEPIASKMSRETPKSNSRKSAFNFEINNDSMDAILNTITLDSPLLSKTKEYGSPRLINDSFDSVIGNLNDSVLDKLSQMPTKSDLAGKKQTRYTNHETNWTVAEATLHESSSFSKTLLNRHSSMPVSPSVAEMNKPSTSGMVFGRYNTMPFKNEDKESGDLPMKCTPEEIQMKRQQAREKLIAKRQLPFTSQVSTQSVAATPMDSITSKKPKFQIKVASCLNKAEVLPSTETVVAMSNNNVQAKPKVNFSMNSVDQKWLIEKKRQEALMKLRRRQLHIHKTV